MHLPFGYQEFPAHWPQGYPVEADWSYLAQEAGMHRVLPDGRIDLLTQFQLNDDGAIADLRLIIAGPSTLFFMAPVQARMAFIGLRFRAGWGGACLGLDPAAIRDATLDDAQVAALLGARLAPVRAARDVIGLRQALHHLAHERIAAATPLISPKVQEAIDLLHISGGRIAVAELASRTAISERSLRRAMQQVVGLPVKTFSSILRFQRTVRLLRADPAMSLTAAAAEGGYSDQAHMSRDFRRLGGFAPTERDVLVHGDLPL